MITNSLLPVTQLLHECPKCGREAMTLSKTGKKEGAFYILDPIVYRSCQCGFEMEYDTRQGTARNKILRAIDEAIRADKIRFCVQAVLDIEGVTVEPVEFEVLSEEALNEKVHWFDYLYTK